MTDRRGASAEAPVAPPRPTTLMDSLIQTEKPSPPKLILYGQPGVGKTSFAAQAGSVLVDGKIMARVADSTSID